MFLVIEGSPKLEDDPTRTDLIQSDPTRSEQSDPGRSEQSEPKQPEQSEPPQSEPMRSEPITFDEFLSDSFKPRPFIGSWTDESEIVWMDQVMRFMYSYSWYPA
jgi:hypothetical protein